jgi:hypothetical protein
MRSVCEIKRDEKPVMKRCLRSSESDARNETFRSVSATVSESLTCRVEIFRPQFRDLRLANMRSDLETHAPELKFDGGQPSQGATVDPRDELDRQRAVQGYVWAVPVVNAVGFWRGLIDAGVSPTEPSVLVFDQPPAPGHESRPAPARMIHAFTILDLARTGPMLADIPAGATGHFWDFHHRGLHDFARDGGTHARRVLLLPPGHDGDVPVGPVVVRSRTAKIFGGLRAILAPGDGAERFIALVSGIAIYPLALTAHLARTRVILNGARPFNQDWPQGTRYFDDIIEGLSPESVEPEDRLLGAMLAPLGIKGGTPFVPDDRMRKILSEAARAGAAMLATTAFATRLHGQSVWPDRQWERNFFPTTPELGSDGLTDPDGVSQAGYQPVGNGRYVFAARLKAGEAQWHCATFHDRNGDLLDGSSRYRFRLQGSDATKLSWSITIYDSGSRAGLSTCATLATNADGSVDVHFAPDAPAGAGDNWIKTIPGRGFFAMFRLYGPLEPALDGSWKLNDIEKID